MESTAKADHRPATIDIDGDGDVGARVVAGLATCLQRRTDRATLRLGYIPAPGNGTLTLDVSLADDPPFATLVERVAAAVAAAGPPGSTGEPELDAVVALGAGPPAHSPHPLWLEARVSVEGLDLLAHPGSEAEDADARALEGHLRTLLAGARDDPRPASALEMLTAGELERLLVQLNDTQAPYPPQAVHELIAQQAARTPDAIAVVDQRGQYTYAELDARANQLAHHLIELGVKPEVLVGIAVTRSAEMLVGLLGILKAGGAYVPVDPAYPAERQAFMLTNSGAPLVITEAELVSQLPLAGVSVVCLDRDWPSIGEHPTSPAAVPCAPDQLAYVIYTSGSTGQPKGVQIPHRALVNFLTAMAREPGLCAQDILVAVTTLSFDIAGLELYLPLVVGARVVVASTSTAADPRALAALLASSDASVMQATPTTWRMLLDSGWRARAGLKALCGGEPLPVALADRLVGQEIELWNMYGPTETTIWSTCARVRTIGRTLTIGRPIANTFLYILDRHRRPVPIGVAGELWIGGDGLARGYRGRDDLTAERFVADPFRVPDGGEPARMYHTGDLARYRADGEVEFLGRIDNQVKVRGFRIELGEIETVLSRHPHVAEAVVVARAPADGDVELAAYVITATPDAPPPVTAGELREFASQALPAYMVPSTVTTLPAFPLTPNGKVDRQALPEPTRERSADHELVAAGSPLESQLVAIWERELDIHPIGVTDDFFELGVTSIVAARLFAAIEHELGDALPLGAIFRASTVRALAGLLSQGERRSSWTSLVPIQTAGSRPPIFCVHGGAGTILHLAALSRRLGPEQPFYALQARGLYGGVAPLTSVPEMADHYLAEMRQVWPSGPWYLGGYCFGSLVAFELAQRLAAAGEEVKLLTVFNGPSPPWIRRWGSHRNQPSWQARAPRPPAPTASQRRAKRASSLARRSLRALRNPRRFWTGLMWELWVPRTRLALALGRPIPEQLRERYFLDLHAKAERAYDPPVFGGEMLVFSGEGLYEDPALGWEPFVAGGVRCVTVPGDHVSNRQAMMEPAVEFVAAALAPHLGAEAESPS